MLSSHPWSVETPAQRGQLICQDCPVKAQREGTEETGSRRGPERKSLKAKSVTSVPGGGREVVCGEPDLCQQNAFRKAWFKPVAMNTVEKIAGSRSHHRVLNEGWGFFRIRPVLRYQGILEGDTVVF